jgi:single-stranded DNA-binding protein
VFVDGKQRTRSWQDEAGQQRYVTELHADTVEFLDGRRD